MLNGKTFYFDYREHDNNDYGFVKISVVSNKDLSVHDLEYNSDGSLRNDKTYNGTYTIENGEWHMVGSTGKEHNYKAIEITEDYWKLQSIKDTSHITNWYLNKPVNYPSDL